MSVLTMVRNELSHCLDWFLPAACLLCGRQLLHSDRKDAFCPSCWPDQPSLGNAFCCRCAQPFTSLTSNHHHCETCLRKPPPFQKVYALGSYQTSLQNAIQSFKYRGNLLLARPLAKQLCASLNFEDGFAPDLLVPVPLHRKRLRQRGYNQSQLLAQQLARHLRRPAVNALQRLRETCPQQGLSAEQRRRNLAGAFSLCIDITDKKVLLIDDVMTTGATVRECSQCLLKADANEVRVAVLGRA